MKLKKMVGLALASVLFLTSACGSGGGGQTAEGGSDKQEKIEYDILISYSTAATTLDNPNDVVTPYVEAKFNIEVGEITQAATSDIPFQEMLAARIAAGNEPDVIIAGKYSICCEHGKIWGWFGRIYR